MLDHVDKKLLATLMENSKAPISAIVKTPGLTREVARYRMQKLQEEGIIKSYVTKIHQPFFATGAVGVLIKFRSLDNATTKFIQSVVIHPKVNWVSKLSGTFDLMFSIIYDSVSDFSNTFNEMQNLFGHLIQEYKTLFYLEELKFDRSGLLTQTVSTHEKLSEFEDHKKITLSYEDKIILKELSLNARIKNVELANLTGLSEDVIRLRIKKLESQYIIRGYTLVLDTNKMGFEGYQLGLRFHQFTQSLKFKLKEYVKNNPYVIFCVHTSGDYNAILSLQAKNRNHFTELLDDLRNTFANELRQYEFQLQLEELKEVYLPYAYLE